MTSGFAPRPPGVPRDELVEVDRTAVVRIKFPPKRGHAGLLAALITSASVSLDLRVEFAEGIPKCVFGQVVFEGLGYQGHKTTHVQETNGFLALPPSAARPNKPLVSRK